MSKQVPSAADCARMGATCACFNLRRATRAVTQLYDAHFDRIGLRATQFNVLAVLAYEQEQGKPATISELAETLVLEQSSLSRNLAVLEREGYVKLSPGKDKRERVVTLTRSGRSALARGFTVWKKAQAQVASMLSGSDLDHSIASLRKMTKGAVTARADMKPAR